MGHEELEAQVLNQARLNTLELLKKQAAAGLSLRQRIQQERWNKKARELNMAPGQKVHIRTDRGQGKNPAKKAKLSWEGPLTILELRPRGNILVRTEGSFN